MTLDNDTTNPRLSLCEQGKESFTREELLACSRGELFGEGNSQLPAPNMLMMDRIVKINDNGGEHGKGEILAELDITPDLWFFDCHFPGDPVMPGCLGLDAMWQLVGFFLGWKDPADRQESDLQDHLQTRHQPQAGDGHCRRRGRGGWSSHLQRDRPESGPVQRHHRILICSDPVRE